MKRSISLFLVSIFLFSSFPMGMLSEENLNIPIQESIEEEISSNTSIPQGDEETNAFKETTESSSKKEIEEPTVFNETNTNITDNNEVTTIENETDNNEVTTIENETTEEITAEVDEDGEINISDE